MRDMSIFVGTNVFGRAFGSSFSASGFAALFLFNCNSKSTQPDPRIKEHNRLTKKKFQEDQHLLLNLLEYSRRDLVLL
jgi:hypothetical protein